MRTFIALVAGSAAGALVGAGLWWLAARSLDRRFEQGAMQLASGLAGGTATLSQRFSTAEQQLREDLLRQVYAQIPPAVNNQIMVTLRSYGITPETSRQMLSLLQTAQARGLV